MARTILVVGAVAWLLAGAAAFVLAEVGTQRLISLLPPLAIDADALGGALTALALALVVIGTVHLFVVMGLRDGRRWATSVGALLASVLAIASIALGATAGASAVREPNYAVSLIGAALLATLAAVGYTLAAIGLMRELGSGSAS